MNLKAIVHTVAVLVLLLPLCPYASTNISLLVVVDQVMNDSVVAAVKSTIDIINNDTLPEYILQYTTDKQVELSVPHIAQYYDYSSMEIQLLVLLILIAPVPITIIIQY